MSGEGDDSRPQKGVVTSGSDARRRRPTSDIGDCDEDGDHRGRLRRLRPPNRYVFLRRAVRGTMAAWRSKGGRCVVVRKFALGRGVGGTAIFAEFGSVIPATAQKKPPAVSRRRLFFRSKDRCRLDQRIVNSTALVILMIVVVLPTAHWNEPRMPGGKLVGKTNVTWPVGPVLNSEFKKSGIVPSANT